MNFASKMTLRQLMLEAQGLASDPAFRESALSHIPKDMDGVGPQFEEAFFKHARPIVRDYPTTAPQCMILDAGPPDDRNVKRLIQSKYCTNTALLPFDESWMHLLECNDYLCLLRRDLNYNYRPLLNSGDHLFRLGFKPTDEPRDWDIALYLDFEPQRPVAVDMSNFTPSEWSAPRLEVTHVGLFWSGKIIDKFGRGNVTVHEIDFVPPECQFVMFMHKHYDPLIPLPGKYRGISDWEQHGPIVSRKQSPGTALA